MQKEKKYPTFLFIVFGLILFSIAIARDKINIDGVWQGEFMPGNDMTLFLSFQSEENIITGKIQLFQGKTQIQDDELSKIIVKNDDLSFFMEAKNTSFSGKIIEEKTQLSGNFVFPDGSKHPVLVTKTEKAPSTNSASKEQSLEAVISPKQLKSDLEFLWQKLSDTHPQLYKHTSREEFEKLHNELASSLTNEMTIGEFFRTIAPFVSAVKCSHTGIRLPESFYRGEDFIPLDIKFIDDKAFVIHSYLDKPLCESGDELLSINGKPVKVILEKIFQAVPVEGENKSTKWFEINNDFAFNYFQFVEINEDFDIQVKDKNGNVKSFTIPAKSIEHIAQSKTMAEKENLPHGSLPMKIDIDQEKSIAVLTVLGFFAQDFNQYNSFLQNTFSDLKSKNIKNLIVDVRGNKGGHPYFAAELLTYLSEKPFVYFDDKMPGGEFLPLTQMQQIKPERFVGSVYVVMDGGCLSTTGHFLSLIKYLKIGTLVGQEAGSGAVCNDGSIQFHLPESGIQVNLPQMIFETAVSDEIKNSHLFPDYFVIPSLNDYLNATDVPLNFVQDIIEKKN